MIEKGVLRVGELLLGRSQFLTCEDLFLMWLTVFNAPCVVRVWCGERTSERSCLAGRKRERLVRECASAKCAIPKCDANGDLGFSIFAIVHDPPSSCSRWAVLARCLWIDDGFAISSCFGADWAGIE